MKRGLHYHAGDQPSKESTMISLIRGFKDILPDEVGLWQSIEQTATTLFRKFGYHEIRIPIMEKTELFARSIGEDTDIVEKEMYTFPDRKGDLLTLRPEATASVVRSYIQHKLYASDPVRKFYLVGPMFRRERPQKGRYRQFYQINVEAFGIESPYVDVQMIFLLHTLLGQLGVGNTRAHINTLGCPKCRPAFKASLLGFLEGLAGQLCADCLRRKDRNPLRVLDCKVPSCRQAVEDAPGLTDYLCDGCKVHFDTVCRTLTELAVPYVHDKRLVRGLDYYTRTTFELQTDALGAQSAVAGGGRYDGLVEALGGPPTPAIGFAIGFDRLVEVVGQGRTIAPQGLDVFIAALGGKRPAKGIRMAFGPWPCRGLSGNGLRRTKPEIPDETRRSIVGRPCADCRRRRIEKRRRCAEKYDNQGTDRRCPGGSAGHLTAAIH
jgi:histidyl-tRNA synthetase